MLLEIHALFKQCCVHLIGVKNLTFKILVPVEEATEKHVVILGRMVRTRKKLRLSFSFWSVCLDLPTVWHSVKWNQGQDGS